MEAPGQLKLSEELETEDEGNTESELGIYEGLVSILSDPSQLLYRALSAGVDEHRIKLHHFYRMQQDIPLMPYVRNT